MVSIHNALSPPPSMSQVNITIDDGGDEGGPVWWRKVRKHLNFYRIHVMYYIFTPLVFSGIFYASNGRYPVAYMDCLYVCTSAITDCGLTTVNLSALTGWQQAILFIEMCIGNPIIVSWITVYLRRHYFEIKFRHVLKVNAERKADAMANPEKRSPKWPSRISALLGRRHTDHAVHRTSPDRRDCEKQKNVVQNLRPDKIRRMDDEPKRINPSGFAVPWNNVDTIGGAQTGHLPSAPPTSSSEHASSRAQSGTIGYDGENKRRHIRQLSDPGLPSRPTSPINADFPRSDAMQAAPMLAASFSRRFPKTFTRAQTIEFAPNVRRRGRLARGIAEDEIAENERAGSDSVQTTTDPMHSRRASQSPHPSLTTGYSSRTRGSTSYKYRGFGGFPMPFNLITRLLGHIFPRLRRRLTRTVTMPATTSLVSRKREAPPGAKSVPYISFDATVGRNSAFRRLSQEEMEELGGVEYRALNALVWIVGAYHITIQLVTFVDIAPYMSMPRWRETFVPPAEIRPQSPAWFSIFQSVSAYTNTGLSLVDKSMVPFQTAYPMVFFMGFSILAGNTGFPVFLRFTIWVLSKLVSETSRARETLHFLLDHPRRCFIFLFPSHSTWFLLTVLCLLVAVAWLCFLVLDIGNPGTDSIPLGVRVVVGFFQAVDVRTAGFTAVSLSVLAAAVKVLFLIMMYISVYPIALSIRSTNVYEEQSLGIFPRHDGLDEEDFEATGSRTTVWSRYLAMHARRQLAFDMWWLALALFVVCINERHNLDDPSRAVWFNIFTLIFELVSAYGTVGLSLGTPNNNFSFSGELKTFSKFVMCLVMIRGRHRILPVAIDRAVMLPSELQRQLDQEADTGSRFHRSVSVSRPVEDDASQGRIDRRHDSQMGDSRSQNQASDYGPSSS